MASALDPDDTSQHPLSDDARSAPISALNASAVFMLRRYLDQPANSLSTSGNLKVSFYQNLSVSHLEAYFLHVSAMFQLNQFSSAILCSKWFFWFFFILANLRECS